MSIQQLVNFPIATNFRFWCPELPLLSELIQDVTIPGITLNPTEIHNRFVDYSDPGEKLVFQEMDLGFSMDENYDAYTEIFSWMSLMAGPDGMSDVSEEQRRLLFCDSTVTLLDNAQRPTRTLIFKDSWPTSLGAMPYDVSGDSSSVKSILSLQFTAMEISPPAKDLTPLGEFHRNH